MQTTTLPGDLQELRAQITRWAEELGFQEIGVTDLNLADHEGALRAWLAKGFHGEMGYLERNLDKRLDPAELLPGTVRIISARMDYLKQETRPLEVLGNPELGYVSRYALGRDYHKTLRRRLARLGERISEAAAGIDHSYRAFTDSAPVLEKALGEKAGLGWIGRHSLLMNRSAGSWFFLGEIFTNLPLPVDPPRGEDHCGACRACMTVCPTGAIVADKLVDARRCISYLTIEHRGSIPEALRPDIGNRIFGCDDCQLHCPWNRAPAGSGEPDFEPRPGLAGTELLTLFAWTREEYAARSEGTALRRISFEQWQRNLAVAIGNGPASPGAIRALEKGRVAADAMVAEHIDWALSRLGGRAEG